MGVLKIIICTFACTIQNVFSKEYGKRTGKGELTFSLMSSFFALVFFLISADKLVINWEILKYAVFFAFSYATATFTMVMAMKLGNLSLTSLFFSYSLIIPTLNGLIFLGDKVNLFKYIGISALLISIFLVRNKSEKTENEKKIGFKWLICVIIGFVANGMCSVIQNGQKIHFDGKYDNEFMIISLFIVVLIFMVAVAIKERKEFSECAKSGIFIGALNGIANGATNLLVMVALAFVPSSVFFPLISAGGIVLTFVFSLFLYKEKFIPRQIVGLLFGIVALVFLNI